MKKISVLLASLALAASVAAQESVDLGAVADSIDEFATSLAPSLPLSATAGNAWSDSYIGQFPHFGVGANVGLTFIPGDMLNSVLDVANVDLSDITAEYPQFAKMLELGMPFPSVNLAARIGGLILPFDIGLRFATIPEDVDTRSLLNGIGLDYYNVGLDLRYALATQKKSGFDFSVGASATYVEGSIRVPLPGMEPISFSDGINDYELSYDDADLYLTWSTVSFDFNAQVSKRILILTPYAGAGLTFGSPSWGPDAGTKVSAGISSPTMYLSTNGGAAETISAEALAAIMEGLEDLGISVPADGSAVQGWEVSKVLGETMDVRVYGGLSVDLLGVYVDLNALYSFIGQNFGANLGVRFQL